MRRIVPLTLFALVISFTGLSQGTTAQDATAPVLPLAPDPAKWCTSEPMPLADVQALYDEVNPTGVATPDAEAPVDEPEGTPADDATVAEATALIVHVIACSAKSP